MCISYGKRLVTICVVALLLTIAGCSHSHSLQSERGRQIDTVVTNNLKQIWGLLLDAEGESDMFPETLALASEPNWDNSLFVCPDTGSRPGSMTSVEEWTDYIYVGNVWSAIPRAALIISPPENHGGSHGYVLCVDGYIARVPARDMHALVKEPWLLETNTFPENIDYLKSKISIRIPKRFRKSYALEIH